MPMVLSCSPWVLQRAACCGVLAMISVIRVLNLQRCCCLHDNKQAFVASSINLILFAWALRLLKVGLQDRQAKACQQQLRRLHRTPSCVGEAVVSTHQQRPHAANPHMTCWSLANTVHKQGTAFLYQLLLAGSIGRGEQLNAASQQPIRL
jgi:hypothetical protein